MSKMLQAMFYPKNVPNVERLLRIIGGIVLIIGALTAQATVGTVGLMLAIGFAAFIMLTGFIGWCPACALVGRKIRKG